MESSLRIVAITNCPAGLAHTYMVAEALEQKARSLGHTIKVEKYRPDFQRITDKLAAFCRR